MTEIFVKDPGDTLDYQIDFTDWLDGDTISSSSWAVSPTGPTLSAQSVNGPNTITTCWVAGGTHGKDYQLTNTIVTTGGRTKQKSMTIQVRE
jgi:hypothetical protein